MGEHIEPFNERQYLYYIYTSEGLRREYRLKQAMDILNDKGGKLYAVTKNLFPKKTLLAWK